MILAAWPWSMGWPGDTPAGRTDAISSLTPGFLMSADRTAYPSMAELLKEGISRVEMTSSARYLPSAASSGTRSAGKTGILFRIISRAFSIGIMVPSFICMSRQGHAVYLLRHCILRERLIQVKI